MSARDLEELIKRDIVLRINAFEAGVLLSKIYDIPTLKEVTEQLLFIKEQLDKAGGVKKELLPDGHLRITDDSGNVVTRPPFPWEVRARAR